jgi:hypothetical protein
MWRICADYRDMSTCHMTIWHEIASNHLAQMANKNYLRCRYDRLASKYRKRVKPAGTHPSELQMLARSITCAAHNAQRAAQSTKIVLSPIHSTVSASSANEDRAASENASEAGQQ